MRRHAPPPALPGWGPMSLPTYPRSSRGGELRRELIVPGLLAGFLIWKGMLFTVGGMLAFALAMWLWFTWKNHRQRGRLLAEWIAVAALLVILSNAGITAPKVNMTADRKAPAERIAKARQDLVGLYGIWGELNQKFPALPDPPQAEPAPKKGHH